MEEEHIVDNAYTIGKDVLGPQLTALYDKHPKKIGRASCRERV